MSESGETPKIQIDSDWKSQAQAEKERLREMEANKKSGAASGAAGGAAAQVAAGGAPGEGEFPPPTWDSLLGTLVTQAMLYLGAFGDPRTGQPIIDLEAARHYIDLLGVLEEKTKGNLTDDEAKNMATILYELRMRYVQIARSVSTGGVASSGGGGQPLAGGGPGGPEGMNISPGATGGPFEQGFGGASPPMPGR